MSALSIDLAIDPQLQPRVAEVLKKLDLGDQTKFFESLSDAFETLTREHITRASQTRHKSAARLGANPTGYLEKLAAGAEGVQGEARNGGVRMTVQGHIFKRAFGPVEVTAKDAGALTIPWRAEAYGRRAGEFDNLFVYQSKRGQAFLARRDGKTLELMFLLKKNVTLSEDRGLLPSEADFRQVAEKTAEMFIDAEFAKLT